MIIGVGHERWRLYTCSDCHPDYDEDEGERYDTAYQIVLPFESLPAEEGQYNPANAEGACPINHCPRCGSYLSLCADDEVRVTRAPQ